jgi:hypothetical protein
MGDKADTGLIIHSILIGTNPKDCLRWDIGQLVGKDKSLRVSLIVHDDTNFNLYGLKRYLVYITPVNDTTEQLWRSYENIPVSLLYDI